MKAKPKGAKYRNLSPRGSVIYYERVVPTRSGGKRRIKVSTQTADWQEAATWRDRFELRTGIVRGQAGEAAPTFAKVAEECRGQLGHLAPTTQDDRKRMLGADGPLVAAFGPTRVDSISRRDLIEWWQTFIEGEGRSTKTGRNYLDALSDVFGWAEDRELIDANPLDGLRAIIRRRQRTQRGRAESESEAHPIEDPAHVDALVAQARAHGGAAGIVTVLMLDAGLRLGEATGLDWSDVEWGRDASDPHRALRVRRSRSRGKYLGKTKSGRERRVALSRRLRSMLQAAWIAAGRPAGGAVARLEHSAYQKRSFPNLCRRAGIGESYSPHDLRDTFASHLISAGVQLGYVSEQLGHADLAITAKHYARWCHGDDYRRPLEVREGEVPADLLARLGEAVSHQSPTTPASERKA
jgi:integrase